MNESEQCTKRHNEIRKASNHIEKDGRKYVEESYLILANANTRAELEQCAKDIFEVGTRQVLAWQAATGCSTPDDAAELRKKQRTALDAAKAAIWDAHYGNGIVLAYVRAVSTEIDDAMKEPTDAAKL